MRTMRPRLPRVVGRNLLVQRQGLVELVRIQQILRQPPHQPRIVRRDFHRALERRRGVLVIARLLVGAGQRRQGVFVGTFIGGRLQLLDGPLRIAQVRIQHRQARERVFVIRIRLDRRVISLLRLHRIVRSAVQPSQHHPAFHVLGILLGDLLVLLDGRTQGVLVDPPVRRVPQRAHVDAAQHAARLQVIGILLQQLLGLRHGVAQLAGLYVEIRQLFEDDAGSRIELQRLLVMLNGPGNVVVLGPLQLRQPLVEPSHGKVVIGAGLVIRRDAGLIRSLRGLRKSGATHRNGEQKRFG